MSTNVDEPTPPHLKKMSYPISYMTAESVDLNARAYGWEIGRMGLDVLDRLPEAVTSTPENPFLNPQWRDAPLPDRYDASLLQPQWTRLTTLEPAMDHHTNPSLSLFDILQSAYDAGAEDAVCEGSFATWLGAQVEEGALNLTVG